MTTNILTKVQKLIALAEHPNTGSAEKAAFMEKAQHLMREYRIAQEDLIAQDPTAVEPISREIILLETYGTMGKFYAWMMHDIARHAGIRVYVVTRWDSVRQTRNLVATLVGYEGDVNLAEWIYTAARFAFADNLEPRNDPERSERENVYRMRKAGLTRRETARRMWNLDTHAAHAKVGTIYKEESAARGETAALDGRGISAGQYRDQYANGFVDALNRRLRQARDAADAIGGALVLHGRKERVDEAFYTQFPSERPAPLSTDVAKKAEKAETPAQRDRRLARQARELQEHIRRTYSHAATAGRAAGEAAAAEVALDRVGSAGRVETGKPGQVRAELI